MTALRETPLERVARPGVELYLKREDLLPYGGGNKVPRFLHALERRGSARRIAAFSDYGCHSFTVLAAMARDPALGIDALELWERPVEPDPYRRALARRYAEAPGVHVRRGSTAGLFVRYALRGLFARRGTYRIGIGGTVRGSGSSYVFAVEGCARQLAAAGAEGPVAHVIALASGDTARAVLAALRSSGRDADPVVGVTTGPLVGHMGLRVRPPSGLHLLKPRTLTWESYVEKARGCHAETGVWLDPEHTLPAWDALDRLPDAVRGMPVVLWVTCPLIETPPFE